MVHQAVQRDPATAASHRTGSHIIRVKYSILFVSQSVDVEGLFAKNLMTASLHRLIVDVSEKKLRLYT